MALRFGNVLHPPSIANSLNASLVPDVGGGPKTSILISGRLEFTSFHVLFGLGMSFPPSAFPSGTSFARAKKISRFDKLNFSPFLEFAMTIPS